MGKIDVHLVRRALVAVLVVDAGLLVLHVVQRVMSERGDEQALLAGTRLSLGTDRGVGEVFGYGLTALIVGLLLVTWRAMGPRGVVFLGWAAMFSVVLLDDALSLHETGGRAVGRWLGADPMGLDRGQVGELLTWAVLSSVPLVLVWVLHRASSPEARQRSWVLTGLVMALVVFGAGVDLVHQLVEERDTVAWLVGTVEDGGELLVLSLTAAYAVGLARSVTEPRGSARPVSPVRTAA